MVEKSESCDSAIELNRTQSTSDDDTDTLLACDRNFESDELRAMREELLENKKMIKFKDKEMSGQMETLQSNLEEIQKLKKLYEDVLNERQDRQCEINNLKGALELNKNTIKQLEHAVQFSDKIAQKFKSQLQKQIASTISLEETLRCSNFELNELKENCSKGAEEIDKRNIVISRLKREISVLEEQYIDAYNENAKQAKYLEFCRDANLELKMQMVQLQQDVGILEIQLKNAQDRIKSYDVVIRDYYTLKKKISQLWIELDIIKQNECRNVTLQAQVDRLSYDLKDLTQLLEDKNKQMEALERSREDSENSNAQIMEQCSNALTTQRTKYERLLIDMGAEIQHITSQLRSLQEVLTKSECESEATTSSLQEALIGVRKQNDELLQECRRLEQQNILLKKHVQEKNAEFTSLCQNLSETQATLDKTQLGLTEAEEVTTQERKLNCEQQVQLECLKNKNNMLKDLLRTRTEEVTALQAQQTLHINSIGLLRKQQECQLQVYEQEIDKLKLQVHNLTANLNRSEYKYTTVMRELCETQSSLLAYTEKEANYGIPQDSSCNTENNMQNVETEMVVIECDISQQDVSTECSLSLRSECSNCMNLSADLVSLRAQLSCVQKQLLGAHAHLTRINNEKRSLSAKLNNIYEENCKYSAELEATKQELNASRDSQASRNRALETRMNSMKEKWAQRNEQLNSELCAMQASFKELKEQYKCTSEMLARRDCELTTANTMCAELRARSREVVRDIQVWHRDQRIVQRELAQNVKRLNEQLIQGKQEKQNLINKINCLQKANSQLYQDLTSQRMVTFETTSVEFVPEHNRAEVDYKWAEVPYEEACKLGNTQSAEGEDCVTNDPGSEIESRWLDHVQSITEQLQRTSSYWNKVLERTNIEET